MTALRTLIIAGLLIITLMGCSDSGDQTATAQAVAQAVAQLASATTENSR